MANVVILPTLITRPNDTAIYAVGDGINSSTVTGVLTELPLFSLGASGTGFLVGLQIVTTMATCQGGVRVHFYNSSAVSPAGIIEDNAVFTFLTGDQAFYQGYVDMPAFNTEDVSSTAAVTFLDGLSKPLTADTNKSVWLQMQLKTGAFTPVALQTFRITAWVVQ